MIVLPLQDQQAGTSVGCPGAPLCPSSSLFRIIVLSPLRREGAHHSIKVTSPRSRSPLLRSCGSPRGWRQASFLGCAGHRVSGQTGSRVSAAARVIVPGPVCIQGRLATAANSSQSQWLITVKVSCSFVPQSHEAYRRRRQWETVLHAVTQGPRLLPTSGSIPQSRSQQAFSVTGQIVNIF